MKNLSILKSINSIKCNRSTIWKEYEDIEHV